ncbi:MAK10-like protein [Tanacetum coccineum]|uniref:MAK10-like protein n=1 Tax=Tanacetum coccineum TaxID=301880 RepID=A0ABQ5GJP1_9ASTR
MMEAHLSPMLPTQVNKITTSCEICSGPHDTRYCMEYPEQAFVDYASSRTGRSGSIGLLEETDHIFGLDDETKSYPVGIVKDVEVHIGKLKLLNDFYVIDMKKDPETPLLVGRGFFAIANAVIDYRKAKIATFDCHFPREWEIARDAEINPFKDVLVFRRMVEFLGAILINLKSNMWESEDLINNSRKEQTTQKWRWSMAYQD